MPCTLEMRLQLEAEIADLKRQLKSYHDENTFLMDQNVDLKRQLAEWKCPVCKAPSEQHGGGSPVIALLQQDLAYTKDELKFWKPMTPEEAEAALDAAIPEPISDEKIREIVNHVTDPSYRPTEPEHILMAAKIEQLHWQLAEANNSLSAIAASVSESGGDNIERLLAIGMLGKLTTLIGNARYRQLCEAETQLTALREQNVKLREASTKAVSSLKRALEHTRPPHGIQRLRAVMIAGELQSALRETSDESEAKDE